MGKRNTNTKEKDELTMQDKVQNAKDKYNRSQNKTKSTQFNRSDNKKERAENDKKDKDGKSKKPRMNDAKWYMPSDTLMKNYNYALEGILGIPTDLSDSQDLSEKNPTIMAISFAHTPGDTSRDILNYANPASASINVAAKSFFIKLSSQNKKTTIYQPQDIALAIFAEAELIAMFSYLVRLYGVALQFNAKNKDVPRELIRAMGVDPDSILNSDGTGMSISDFRDALNLLAQQANALPFVGGIKAFEKAWAMYSSYYCDNPINMAQLYVPYPATVGVYTEALGEEEEVVKSIVYETLGSPDSPMSVRNLLNKLKKMLDNLQTSSLMNYVYPDILNFMLDKGAGAFNFPILSDLYVIAPEYNELWLTQIHNLEIPGHLTMNDIVQDPANNIIKTNLVWETACDVSLHRHYVDFPFSDGPDVESKIDALMFKPVTRGNLSAEYPSAPAYHSCADFVPFSITILGCGETLVVIDRTHAHYYDEGEVQIASLLSKFKAAPILYVYDTTTRKFKFTVGSLDTFGVLSYSDIKPVFDQAIMGLFTYDAKETLGE